MGFLFLVVVLALITAPALANPVLSPRHDTRSTFSADFNQYPSGEQYSAEDASADFGDVSGWDSARMMISDGRLRAKMDANKIGGAGGTLAYINLDPGTEFEMEYTVNFHSQFDWSRGGKVGWGFAFGDGAGGCTKADGDGASMRLMWYTDDGGRTFFRPYLYYKTMPGTCGDDFGLSYPPASSYGGLQRKTDYVIYMYVRSNTGSKRDGWAVIKVDGVTLIDRAVQWTDNEAKSMVRTVLFQTFRGGSRDYWASNRVGLVYYDNFSIRKLA